MHRIRNKSLRNILKRIGPNIEPCDAPDKMFWKALKIVYSNILFLIF